MDANEDFERLWADACEKYADISGKKLEDLPRPDSADDLVASVENQNEDFKHFRHRAHTLLKVLKWTVQPIELVGNLAAGAASAAFPPSSMIFGAVQYLINCAKGVSDSYDAIEDLLNTLKDFTGRLDIYTSVKLSLRLQLKVTEILTTIIEILAISTKKIKSGFLARLQDGGKNLLMGNDKEMQGLRNTLDRLTNSENLLVGAETFVEATKTGDDVRAIQVSLREQNIQMASARASTEKGFSSMLSGMAEDRAEAKEERALNHIQAVKRFLNPSSMPQERFELLKREGRLVPGSGDWIRSEDNYEDWLGNGAPILWISGNPGSGKSFLAHKIIMQLQDKCSATLADSLPGHFSVAYFFFREDKPETQSFHQAARDIAYQLTRVDPGYAKHLAANSHYSEVDIASVSLAWNRLIFDYWLDTEVKTTTYIVLDGIDESLLQDREIFFELLTRVEEAGMESKLRIAILGRPQVLSQMIDDAGLEKPPTIYVDSTKNAADIAQYVQASMTKSLPLTRLSNELKAKILDTLINKAGGMFMWVNLMIMDLTDRAKRKREADVEKALNEAPKGLNEMLRRVLEGYSASADEDDASDINDMLMWVTLAGRPLCLGELDAVLRLKSEEGQGLFNLEGQLRATYAGLFTLSREDGLTNADLLAPQHIFDDRTGEGDWLSPRSNTAAGKSDFDPSFGFNSSPRTTTISFSHASVSDFFRNPKQSMVCAPGGNHPQIGVNLEAAKILIFKTCIDILIDDDLAGRMDEAVSLRSYGAKNWLEHLQQADRGSATAQDRLVIGMSLAKMLNLQHGIQKWAGFRSYAFWTEENARSILTWIKDEKVVENSEDQIAAWLRSITESSALDVFQPAMMYSAKRWLAPEGEIWSVDIVPRVMKGLAIDESPTLSASQLEEVADFAGLNRNAEWHRRLGMSLRCFCHYDESIQQFQKALELDPANILARGGISKVYKAQGKYAKAIELCEVNLSAIADGPETAEASKNLQRSSEYTTMAECYDSLAENCEEFALEQLRLRKLAYENYAQALRCDNKELSPVKECIEFLTSQASYRQPWTQNADLDLASKKDPTILDAIPSPMECFERIMDLLHDMSKTQRDERHTNLTFWLCTLEHGRWNWLDSMAVAARETGQLEWLQERFGEAIAFAKGDLRSITEAKLRIYLAELYSKWGQGGEKALLIWERMALQAANVTKDATEINDYRHGALNSLGSYCVDKALQEPEHSAGWIAKLERFLPRERAPFSSPTGRLWPSDIALKVAAWYAGQGRIEEARRLMKPRVSTALEILSDDDPGNDAEGYVHLGLTFLALRDNTNATAALHSIREMRDGSVMLLSDLEGNKQDDDHTGAQYGERISPPSKTEAEELEGSRVSLGYSYERVLCGSGVCSHLHRAYDNFLFCPYDGLSTCERCHALLVAEKLPFRICDKSHEFFKVPELKTRFERGEVVVDGKIMQLRDWKEDVRRQWGL